jgi:hypothetical protein
LQLLVAILVATVGTSHFTSHVTRHTSHVTRHTSRIAHSPLSPLPGGAVTGLLVKPIEAHTTLNYFSDSAFWHVPMDFKKMEEERGVEAI